MFEGTKRRSAPFWILPLDILKLLGLFACLGLSLFRACAPVSGAPLTIDAQQKQVTVGARGEVFGNAAPGSTVNIYQGSTLLGSTMARTNGTWNFALPPLAAGSYAISAQSESGAAVPVNVDVIEATKVVVPEVPTAIQETALPASAPVILSPVGGAVLPQSQLGNAEGTANAGNSVALFDGDVKIGETTAGPNGRWSLALPALSVGPHRLSAQATGGDGVAVASSSVQLNVMAPIAPTATAEPPRPTATAAGAAPSATTAPAATAAPAATTAPAATATAEPAQPTATAVAAAPAAQGVAIAVPATGAELPAAQLGNVSGTGTAGNTITLRVGDKPAGEGTVGADGKWSLALPKLDVGTYTIVANEKDASGKEVATTTTEVKVVVAATGDAATAPLIVSPANEPPAIASPADGDKLPAAKTTTLSGEAAAGSKVAVMVDGAPAGEATADSAGKWTIDVADLKPGEHVISAKDANGDAEDATITVLAPPAAPVITNIKDGSKVEAGKPVAVVGTGPANSTITVYQSGSEVGQTQSDAKGAWKLTPNTPIEAGKYQITAVASDEATGDSEASAPVEIEAGITVLLPTTGGDLE